MQRYGDRETTIDQVYLGDLVEAVEDQTRAIREQTQAFTESAQVSDTLCRLARSTSFGKGGTPMTRLYYVDEDQADDPEVSSHSLRSASEIASIYPMLAPLIVGDGTESLTYVHELWRVKIEPAGEVF